jgi:putative ATP-binding cassette transporter
MSFVRLLLSEAGPSRLWLILATLAAGLSMGAMLVVVNTVVDDVRPEEVRFTLVALFIAACAGFIVAKSFAVNLVVYVVESIVNSWRARIIGAMREMDLAAFERVGGDHIALVLTRELQVLSTAGPALVHAATTSVMLTVTSLYVAQLSLIAFVAILVALATAVQLYRLTQVRTRELIDASVEAENAFSISFNHMLHGFQELKLSRPRSDELYAEHVVRNSQQAAGLKIDAGRRATLGDNVINLVFYALVGYIVFVLPYSVGSSQTAAKLINVILFSVGAVELVVRGLPMLDRSSVAIDELRALEAEIEREIAEGEQPPSPAPPAFRQVQLRDVVYSYRAPDGERSFMVGPIDLTIDAGELIFIVGGNGSGKSTLLMLLTRLYNPEHGLILWDGQPVDRSNVNGYRHLFSAILSEFHLFDRLYGLPDVPEDRVNRLIAEMEIAEKVKFFDGRFSTLELSTGQRKRIAMIVSQLEDRPIMVFDEWAADQDPRFRRHFYNEILPALRAAGKTVIAVSHDDRYFDVADRVLVMENGQLADLEAAA